MEELHEAGFEIVTDEGTGARDRNTGQFLQGVSGNPAGRPKGSRNKLAEQFVADLFDDWQLHGREVLEAARLEKPADYLKVVASILPKEIKVGVETMTEQELDTRINLLTERLGMKLVPAETAESQVVQTIEMVPDSRKN